MIAALRNRHIRQGTLLPQSIYYWAWNASFALRVTTAIPFIGYPSQPEWGLSRDLPSLFTCSVAGCDRLPVIVSFFTQCPRNLQHKWRGLEGNYWVGADTSVYHAWPSGKGIKVAYITAGSGNVRFIRDAKKWTTSAPKADSRRRQMQVITYNTRYGIVFGSAWRFYIYLIGITIVYFIWASTTVEPSTCLGRRLVWTTTRLGRPQSLARIVSNNKVPGVSDHLLNATSDRVIWSNRQTFKWWFFLRTSTISPKLLPPIQVFSAA